MARQLPLDGGALKAALLDGLRFWSLATGTPVPGNAHDMVDQQLAAVRRACSRTDPPGVVSRPLLQLHKPEPPAAEAEPQLPWWNRD